MLDGGPVVECYEVLKILSIPGAQRMTASSSISILGFLSVHRGAAGVYDRASPRAAFGTMLARGDHRSRTDGDIFAAIECAVPESSSFAEYTV